MPTDGNRRNVTRRSLHLEPASATSQRPYLDGTVFHNWCSWCHCWHLVRVFAASTLKIFFSNQGRMMENEARFLGLIFYNLSFYYLGILLCPFQQMVIFIGNLVYLVFIRVFLVLFLRSLLDLVSYLDYEIIRFHIH